jgi:ketosteroid isomerase-like protein
LIVGKLGPPFESGVEPFSMSPGQRDTGEARKVLVQVQDAFRKNDYARLAALYHDDIDWVFHGPTSIFQEVGHRRGKVEVFKTMAALNTLYRFEHYATEQLLAEGNAAASVANVRMVQRSTGRIIQCKIASFHRVRDGLVVEYRGFTDSFDAAEQVLGREFPF